MAASPQQRSVRKLSIKFKIKPPKPNRHKYANEGIYSGFGLYVVCESVPHSPGRGNTEMKRPAHTGARGQLTLHLNGQVTQRTLLALPVQILQNRRAGAGETHLQHRAWRSAAADELLHPAGRKTPATAEEMRARAERGSDITGI